LAPLLLSAVLPLSHYGMVEYALSLGQILSVGLALGVPSSIPYLLLKRGQSMYAPIFSLHLIVIIVPCMLIFAVCKALDLTSMGLAALSAAISVTQTMESAKFRSAGNPAGSSLAEGVLYGLIMAFGIGAAFRIVPKDLNGLSLVFLAYLLGSLTWNLARFPWKMRRLRIARLYKISLTYGMRIVPASIANVGLVSSGRFFIGQVGTFELVAIFSLVYRMCAPIVAVHQFISNLIFPKLYTATPRDFEAYFVRLSFVLIACGVGAFLLGPHLAGYFLGEKAATIAKRGDLFLLMSIVMIFWSQMSLMELFMERENRAYLQLPGFIAGCAIAALCLFIPAWKSADKAATVTVFQGTGLAVAVLYQFFRSGAPAPQFPKARLIVVAQAFVLLLTWCFTALG
jgi:O-antigen/teichoic acid export membrane protein